MLSRLRALTLLSECTGVDIWPVEYCQEQGVPQEWVDELADAFESGFARNSETIYYGDSAINQFHGVADLDLAMRLGTHLGIDVDRATATALSREAKVRAIKEAVEEG